jgi:glycine hydroxymethyltransferase
MHVIAGKAVAFGEALKPEFKVYAQAVIDNAQILAETLRKGGLDIVAGGTDTHLMLVDLRPKKLTGNVVEHLLERAGMTCNKNGIPFDPEKPTVTSGIRLGSPAATTRGFGTTEFKQIGEWICEVMDAQAAKPGDTAGVEQAIRSKVQDLCRRFPIYQ